MSVDCVPFLHMLQFRPVGYSQKGKCFVEPKSTLLSAGVCERSGVFGCKLLLGAAADLSDLAAGAAGAATSTPLLWRRSDRSLRLTPSPVTAGNPVSACVAGQCH